MSAGQEPTAEANDWELRAGTSESGGEGYRESRRLYAEAGG